MSKSAITINPIHPGEILRAEFLDEFGLSARALAMHLDVPTNRITRVINGQSAITAETASLLAAALNTTPEFWMNLQMRFDMETARADQGIVARVSAIPALAMVG